MKKILYSSLVFAGISVLFGICYYFSFRNALLHYNREAVEQNTKILNEILESSSESERLLQQMLNTDEPVYPVSVTQDTLRENASYFLETYYLQSQTEEREELALPGFMVGIDRKELEAYLKGYMEDLHVNEYLKGLVSYEIISFSETMLTVRKTYDETKVTNQFYVCRKGDFIVVYYSDLKTVYEYTEIPVNSLPEEIQRSVERGFYVKNAQELYSILEGYTS